MNNSEKLFFASIGFIIFLIALEAMIHEPIAVPSSVSYVTALTFVRWWGQ